MLSYCVPGEETRTQCVSQVLDGRIYVFSGGDAVALLIFNALENAWSAVGEVPFEAPCGEGLVLNGDYILFNQWRNQTWNKDLPHVWWIACKIGLYFAACNRSKCGSCRMGFRMVYLINIIAVKKAVHSL